MVFAIVVVVGQGSVFGVRGSGIRSSPRIRAGANRPRDDKPDAKDTRGKYEKAKSTK